MIHFYALAVLIWWGIFIKKIKPRQGLDQSVEPFTAMRDVFGSFFGVGPKSWS